MEFILKKYNIIYADPPWRYYVYAKKENNRTAEHHYPTLSLDEIKNLPVNEIADENCLLFLWATFPTMMDAFKVIEAWGFQYKTTAFVWVKQNRKSDSLFMGLGFWTRANAEICLLATKGHPKRFSKCVHQVVMTHVEKHSKKPDEVRKRIVELAGDLPRIELFARHKVDGWDAWGNEVECDIALRSERRHEDGVR